jgi:DNA repair protein RadA/Sms
MSKVQHRYVCQECGRVSAQQMGKCPTCGAWNSQIEEVIEPEAVTPRGGRSAASAGKNHPRRLSEISTEEETRIPLPIGEFARVLGGGIVPGSIVLVGGDPGIGKSTLMLQMAAVMATQRRVLYVSGEESERQIHMRAVRLLKEKDKPIRLPADLFLYTETNLEAILTHTEDLKPDILIVDSIQTVFLSENRSSAGSVTQLRECAARLREMAKESGTAVFVIGHVTKEGMIAGPRVLEHIVDTVLYLEGDRFQSYRLLRSVKNRFGATSEVGVFEMAERGMNEVLNPSEAFLIERMINAPGSAIAVTMEGTRPILVEVQALTNPSNFGNPRRTPNGLDFNRMLIIIAVLTRRAGINLVEQDVIANVIGGLQVDEPAADLALAAAIASSFRDVPVKADTVLIGEVGLSGELRQASQMNARLKEAQKLGFKTAVVPQRIKAGEPYPPGLQVVEVRTVREALNQALLHDWAVPDKTKTTKKRDAGESE